MSLRHFLFSRIFIRHFIFSMIATVAIILITLQLLSFYTLHGKHIAMPDYTGLTFAEIENIKLGRDFEFVILDSVYDDTYPKGSIFSQDPVAGSKVKRNRKVYLTTVAVLPEQVTTPDLVDLTLRQAIATLETYGLTLGKLEFIPDIGKNAVLHQLHNGEYIPAGTPLSKGSTIDLVLGQGLGSERISVPFLLGLTPVEVNEKLSGHFLSAGAAIYLKPTDTIMPRAYRQSPPWNPNAFIKLGETMDVWYKSAHDFDLDSLLQLYPKDTIIYNDSIINDIF